MAKKMKSLIGDRGIKKKFASPSSRDWKDSSGMSTESENPDGSKRKRLDTLPRQVFDNAKWPTPKGNEEGVGICAGTGHMEMLNRLVEEGVITEEEKKQMWQGWSGGQLNPVWVSWLMGWLIGITEDGEITDWTDRRPLVEVFFLSWDTDPADFSEPLKFPTPNTMDGMECRSEEAMDKVYKGHRKGRTAPCNLREFINPKMWPTPRASNPGSRPNRRGGKILAEEAKKTYPTPRSRDYKGGSGTVVFKGDKAYRESDTTGTKYGVTLDAFVEGDEKRRLKKRRKFPTPSVMDTRTDIRKPEEKSKRARKGGCANLRERVEEGVGLIPRVEVNIKDRVNRLKALGNGQVPLCFYVAWKLMHGEDR